MSLLLLRSQIQIHHLHVTDIGIIGVLSFSCPDTNQYRAKPTYMNRSVPIDMPNLPTYQGNTIYLSYKNNKKVKSMYRNCQGTFAW
jgi:hypothetical protein